MRKSVTEVCEIIWELEKQYRLNNVKIDNVYYWPLIRYLVFSRIMNETGGYGQAHSDYSGAKFKKVTRFIVNSLKNNPLFSGKKDVIVFDHNRKVKVDNQFYDIYTRYLIDDLIRQNTNFEVLEYDYLNQHYIPADQYRKYADFEKLFSYFYKFTIHTKIDAEAIKVIKDIEEAFWMNCEVKLDLLSLIIKEVRVFRARYDLYKWFFRMKKTQTIYCVVSYAHKAMISAAQDLNIKVIEIQHGVISKYHLGYSYPKAEGKIPYFPDQLYLFGEYWKHSSEFPVNDSGLVVYGFPYLTTYINKNMKLFKKMGQILFLSQGTIGKELAELALELAKKLNSSYKIIYKLHPGEYDRWKSEYPGLLQAQQFSNIEIIDNNNLGLHQLQAESEFQIGVYSTAIYEGLAMRCKTILIELPGMEYMEELINKKLVRTASNTEEIIRILPDLDELSVDSSYFFESHVPYEDKLNNYGQIE